LEILEYCDPFNIISSEQYYLDNLKPEHHILSIARSSKGFKHSEETKELLRNLNLSGVISDETKLNISIHNSKSNPVVVMDIKYGSEVEFSSNVKASNYMGIFPNHFNYYLSKKPVKEIYLVVKAGGIDITADYRYYCRL
jgi:hypothetical protein